MQEILDFLRRLHDNNDREWFDAHRAEWTRVKARFADFTAELIEGIAAFDPSVRGLRPQECTYRIARDTRFAGDKRPYKNWISAFVAPHGKQSGYAGYYFHLEPSDDGRLGNHLLAAGAVCIEPALLRSIREEVLDHGGEMMRENETPAALMARSSLFSAICPTTIIEASRVARGSARGRMENTPHIRNSSITPRPRPLPPSSSM